MKEDRQKFSIFTHVAHSYAAIICLFLLPGCNYIARKHTIENWHQLRAAGDVAYYKHDYAAAQKCFDDALKIAQSMPDQPVRLAVVLEDLSKVCLAANDVGQALIIFDQALALANKRSQAPKKQIERIEESLGPCLNNLGQVFAKAKKYEQAAIAFREARALFLDLYKLASPILVNFIIGSYLAWTIDGLGTSYKEMGQLKEARQAYFSVKDYNIIKGLSLELRQKLVNDFSKIPDTPKDEQNQYYLFLLPF